MASAQVTTLGSVVAEFERHALLAHVRVRIAAERWAKEFIGKVRENASGRPGPEIVSGRYVDSFYYDVQDEGVELAVDIGSTEPQMYRLEFGFVGTDARGAQYEQPPFPHWRPALDTMGEVVLEETMAAAIDFDAP